MTSRKRSAKQHPRIDPEGLSSPFAELGKILQERRLPLPARPSPRKPPQEARADADSEDLLLFRQAMADVKPLSSRGADRVEKAPPPPPPPEHLSSEESEVIATLSDLISGKGEFRIKDTPEYMEGVAPGLDPGLAHRLHRGDFSVQKHLDLHGLTVEEAHRAVLDLFNEVARTGQRCLLLIHGRGLNSPEGKPVIKERVKSWLSRGRLARQVLAFATARACDGGAGAVYVLLRKPPFRRLKSR